MSVPNFTILHPKKLHCVCEIQCEAGFGSLKIYPLCILLFCNNHRAVHHIHITLNIRPLDKKEETDVKQRSV